MIILCRAGCEGLVWLSDWLLVCLIASLCIELSINAGKAWPHNTMGDFNFR